VKIGLEIDYIEGAEDLLAPFFDNFSLDFCLCSIHCIPRFGWKHLSDYHSNTDNSEVYKEYFRLSRAALKSGLFHSLAHLDFIWRYLNWPVNEHEEMLSEISGQYKPHCNPTGVSKSTQMDSSSQKQIGIRISILSISLSIRSVNTTPRSRPAPMPTIPKWWQRHFLK
jgi:hypothetical protein